MKFNKILFTSLLSISVTASSVPLLLTHEPLFLNQSVPPALAITFDDSGSMAWSDMPDDRRGGTNFVSFASSDYNLLYYNPDIVYRPPIRSDGSSFPNSNFTAAKFDGYYELGALNYSCGDNCTNSINTVNLSTSYKAVRSISQNYPNGSVSFNYAGVNGNGDEAAFYFTWNGPTTADLATMRTAGESTTNETEKYTKHGLITAGEKQNFANWYSYYNTRSKLARAAMSHAFVNFGPDFKIDWQQINNNQFDENGGSDMELFTGTHRDNFYKWLFGIPASGSTPLRRSTELAGLQFEKSGTTGPYYDDNFGAELSCQQNFHIAVSDGSWNSTAGVTANTDNSATTFPPVVEGGVGYSYDPTSGLSKMYSGENSATLADTTFEFWRRDLRPDLANSVPVFIEDFTDINGVVVSVDTTEKWWDKPELFWNPNNDPASWQHMVNFNIGLGLSGHLDQETDLQLIRNGTKSWPGTEEICYKGNGNVTTCRTEVCRINGSNNYSSGRCYNDDDIVNSCYQYGNPQGYFTCSNRIRSRYNPSLGRVDDVWHASINSRGKYFSARDPNELATSLNKVVSNIIQRKGRASAGSVSSNVVSDATLAFKTGYDTSDWSGFVIASPLNPDGSFGDVSWDAGCLLTGGLCPSIGTIVNATNDHISRNIFTYINGVQYDFKPTDLPTLAQGLLLNSEFIENNPTVTATDIINYIRGDRSKERSNNGVFRDRRSLLGDVIHSPAQIVRGPGATYVDEIWQVNTPEYEAAAANDGYDKFREDNEDRDNVILVGANDGMLHAFAAGIQNTTNGGDEYWAYIPSSALNSINELADPIAPHKTRVDAAPFVKDAFINGDWSTVALGNLRHGGKMFYALDLGADPTQEPTVMWEFDQTDDADMGYSYAGGIITRVYNETNGDSKWVAFLPNGYSSLNNKSVMYAVDLESGEILHKWTTGLGDVNNPNGMGPPVAADFVAYDSRITGGGEPIYGADQSTDFVYAGDLHGNLYRFDAQDVFSTGTSTAEIMFSGDIDLPITTAPRVFTPDDSTSDVMVIFGTGKYIETPDRGIIGAPTQYLFGLRDARDGYNQYSKNDSRLIEQSISSAGGFRDFTSNEVSNGQGWKVALPVLGERMVNLLGRNNQANILTVITTIPNGRDPCLPGGQSWIMAIDSNTGGSLANGGFFNGGQSDGVFINDLALGSNTITTPGGNTTIVNVDTGGLDDSDNIQFEGLTQKWGRKSWHRIILN